MAHDIQHFGSNQHALGFVRLKTCRGLRRRARGRRRRRRGKLLGHLLDLSKHTEGDDNRDKQRAAPGWQVWNATISVTAPVNTIGKETKALVFPRRAALDALTRYKVVSIKLNRE